MTEVEELWRPHPGFQFRFLESGAFECLGGGAAGPGKTDCLIAKAADYCQHPSARGLFLRTSYKDTLEIRDRMELLYPRLGATWNAENSRWSWPSGATCRVGYGETPKEIGRYLGQEFTFLCFDELGLLPREREWLLLLSRLRSTDSTVPLRARASANPGGPGHAWIKRRFVDATAGGTRLAIDPGAGTSIAFVPGKAGDNPSLAASYWARLNGLPEPLRSWLRDGDWSAGMGLALMVTPDHLVRPFEIPPYWTQFGAFDWGYNHPFAFGWFAVSEDGDHYLVDSVIGRRQLPNQIAESIRGRVPIAPLAYIVAGHDVEHQHKARGENTPTIAEQMAAAGVHMTLANIDRVAGLNNLRAFMHHPPGEIPRFRIMDRKPRLGEIEAANRQVFHQLQSMVVNPDRIEDVLKVDADDQGQGGDDLYDMVRYGLASRATAPETEGVGMRTSDPAWMAREAREQRQVSRFIGRQAGRVRVEGPDSL